MSKKILHHCCMNLWKEKQKKETATVCTISIFFSKECTFSYRPYTQVLTWALPTCILYMSQVRF